MNEGMASLVALIIIGWLVAPLFDELDKSGIWNTITYPISWVVERIGPEDHPVLVVMFIFTCLPVFFTSIIFGCFWFFDVPAAI